ncbi:MucR family transcriptional regulator [Sphingobium sp. YR657]|uniref:MucR family transcriptional regulator n=1 Tax=Sphingobium sp. YR657 TaxID=1884366 RepID=UPI0020C91E55|nr:MucR family transcriptional regulator [Sphingobium sp. YR657]
MFNEDGCAPMAEDNQADITALTVQLLSAYVSRNEVASEKLADLIASTRTALTKDLSPPIVEATEPAFKPAVTVRKSLASPDHLVSLIDGKPYKTLRRHLTAHGLTAEQYRERYNLPGDYPMVAPSFSEARRAIAAKIGLGKRTADEGSDTAAPHPKNSSASAAADPVAKADPVVEKRTSAAEQTSSAKAKPVRKTRAAKTARVSQKVIEGGASSAPPSIDSAANIQPVPQKPKITVRKQKNAAPTPASQSAIAQPEPIKALGTRKPLSIVTLKADESLKSPAPRARKKQPEADKPAVLAPAPAKSDAKRKSRKARTKATAERPDGAAPEQAQTTKVQ